MRIINVEVRQVKVLILGDLLFQNSEEERLISAGYELEYSEEYNGQNVDVLVGVPKDVESVFLIPQLKFIQLLSAGYEKLDLKKLKDNSITLANARGVYSVPMAEYVIGKILAYYKQDNVFLEKQKEKVWYKENICLELTNKTVAILGTGSIGIEIAKRLTNFGCNILGVNTSGKEVEYFNRCYNLSDLDIVLSQSDIVVCALPLNNETYQIMNKNSFMQMKKDAMFINVGRGKQISENDLIDVLDHHLSCVVLDVFQQEPLPITSKLWQHPKVIITPHISNSSELIKSRMNKLVINNLLNFINNREMENKVI